MEKMQASSQESHHLNSISLFGSGDCSYYSLTPWLIEDEESRSEWIKLKLIFKSDNNRNNLRTSELMAILLARELNILEKRGGQELEMGLLLGLEKQNFTKQLMRIPKPPLPPEEDDRKKEAAEGKQRKTGNRMYQC